MGFEDAKRQILEALRAGTVEHDPRGEGKNLLVLGQVDVATAIELIERTRGHPLITSMLVSPGRRVMKSIVLEGQLTEAPCETCQRFTQARFSYGPVELEDGLVVENIMRATCESCGAVVSLAQQSAYLFRQALSRHQRRRTTVRLPQELADFIALKLSLVGMRPSKVDLFFRALLLAARGHEQILGQALTRVEDPVLAQRLGVTVNLSLRPIAQDVLDQLLEHSGLRNASEVLRRLLVLADAEGLEFGPRVTQVTEELAFTAA